MSEPAPHTLPDVDIEQALNRELAQGDAMIAAARPVLLHLLCNSDQAMFSDQVVARVRGILADLARQWLYALAAEAGIENRSGFADEHGVCAVETLQGEIDLLAHAHGLTLESQLASRLHDRSAIDPVLSPLLQELAAASDPALAAAAMQVLASQARFLNHQRRMALPLAELPADVLPQVLQALGQCSPLGIDLTDAAMASVARAAQQEQPRLMRIDQLLCQMGTAARRALQIDHAGAAIFASALAMAAGQARETVLLSLGERQRARLGLTFRAAGMSVQEADQQFHFLHPDLVLPAALEQISVGRAAELLMAQSGNEGA